MTFFYHIDTLHKNVQHLFVSAHHKAHAQIDYMQNLKLTWHF